MAGKGGRRVAGDWQATGTGREARMARMIRMARVASESLG